MASAVNMPSDPALRTAAAAARLARTWRPDEGLPWRRDPSPYRVFLAEFLLVRTRWDVVARRFEEIFARFPDPGALARASEEEIAAALAPLGLRRRAALLRRAAGHLLERHGGQIPPDPAALREIPGVGEYLAAAVAALAFGADVVPADVNVFRFLSRLTGIPMGHPTKGSPALRALLPHLSPSRGGPPAAALLDFLRLVCRPRRPRCPECPLRDLCAFGSAVPPLTGPR